MASPPSPTLIADLEDLLAKANTGELRGLVYVSTWDDGSVNGPIQTKWQVMKRPVIYVLDAKGVIRNKNVTGDDLDSTVDLLLEELTQPAERNRQ